jgi:hypothetical protein
MSSVRMCDQCSEIFSEAAEGWSTFSGSTRRRDKDSGEWRTVSVTRDACPDCTELIASPRPRPSQALTRQPHYEPDEPLAAA